jgi:hypothetical protein
VKALFRKRLLKLAAHLENGKLGHKKFNFAVFNGHMEKGILKQADENGCATLGCAIGECPFVFPRLWEWSNGFPKLKQTNGERWSCVGNGETFSDVEAFFDLFHSEARHLFMPHRQHPGLYGGVILNVRATRKQVASNIRAFVAKKEKETP